MKLLIAAIGLLMSVNVQAAETTFASCSGDHHGTYIDFKVDSKNQVYLETSNDGEDAPEKYEILAVKTYSNTIPKAGQSWAIRKAIAASIANDDSYKEIIVKSVRKGSTLYVQLNKILSGENFLSSEGYVEQLICQVTTK